MLFLRVNLKDLLTELPAKVTIDFLLLLCSAFNMISKNPSCSHTSQSSKKRKRANSGDFEAPFHR